MKLKLILTLFILFSGAVQAAGVHGRFVTGQACSGPDFTIERRVTNLQFGRNEFRNWMGGALISQGTYIFVFGRLAGELTDLDLYPSRPRLGDGDGLYYNRASFWSDSGHYGSIIRNDKGRVFFYYVKPEAYGVRLEIWNQHHSQLVYEKNFSECVPNN